jgi:hypothetical protein
MEENMSKLLSEFIQDERRAVVLVSGEGYDVQLFDGAILKRTQPIMGHTQQYAEDCAENWVLKVIKD